jgi:hypothetical protein
MYWISFFTPTFFLVIFSTSILLGNNSFFPKLGLYLDQILPKTNITLFFILLPFLIMIIPLFGISFICVFLSEYFRSVRWKMKMDSLIVLFYVGSLWIPILSVIFT